MISVLERFQQKITYNSCPVSPNRTDCGGLKETGLPREQHYRRSGFIEGGRAWLEKGCQCRGRLLGLIYVQATPSGTGHFLLPVRALSSSAMSDYTWPCLTMMIMEKSLKT